MSWLLILSIEYDIVFVKTIELSDMQIILLQF